MKHLFHILSCTVRSSAAHCCVACRQVSSLLSNLAAEDEGSSAAHFDCLVKRSVWRLRFLHFVHLSSIKVVFIDGLSYPVWGKIILVLGLL